MTYVKPQSEFSHLAIIVDYNNVLYNVYYKCMKYFEL